MFKCDSSETISNLLQMQFGLRLGFHVFFFPSCVNKALFRKTLLRDSEVVKEVSRQNSCTTESSHLNESLEMCTEGLLGLTDQALQSSTVTG